MMTLTAAQKFESEIAGFSPATIAAARLMPAAIAARFRAWNQLQSAMGPDARAAASADYRELSLAADWALANFAGAFRAAAYADLPARPDARAGRIEGAAIAIDRIIALAESAAMAEIYGPAE